MRDLKARYRGSVLGFFWSFANPLLLLMVYTFVFSVVLTGRFTGIDENYELFFENLQIHHVPLRLIISYEDHIPE